MTTTEVNNIVESIAKDCGFLNTQYNMLKRFSLHKLTNMPLDKIAAETGTKNVRIVYASIQRVSNEKRFQEFKSRLFSTAQ